MNNPEELSELLRQYNLDSEDVKRHLKSGTLTQATFDSDNRVLSLIRMVKDQEILIQDHQEKENEYK